MRSIENIHSHFFEKVLSEVANAKTFLKFILPMPLQNRMDLTAISFDPTSYISPQYKSSFSDIVVKCRTQDEQSPVDIYFLFEHKSFPDEGVLLQLLRYMDLMWQKDYAEKKPLRVIVPIVFYHGKGEWQLPTQFVEQFSITEEWKPYLLNFSFILFDTNAWDWEAESSQPLKENIYLLSAMMLMKAAFNKDSKLIRQVFQLWQQMGFINERERVDFLLIYVTVTQDIPAPQLEEMLEENKLKGEEIMPTLAQRWMDEGALADRQEMLTMLLSTRFQLNEAEKQLIRKVETLDKLAAALKLVVTAQTKEEVLASMQTEIH